MGPGRRDQVSKSRPGIVQAYLANPLLIDGFKCAPPPAPGPPESRGSAPALRVTARRIIREARRRFDIRLYAVATSFNPVCPRAPCRGTTPSPPPYTRM